MKYILIANQGDYATYQRTFDSKIELIKEFFKLWNMGWSCKIRKV